MTARGPRRPSPEEEALFRDTVKGARRPAPPAAKRAPCAKPAAAPASRAAQPRSDPFTGGLDGATEERLRRGRAAPDMRLDLHGLTEAAAHDALLAALRTAQARGHRLVLVITGKGAADDESPFAGNRRGVLRTLVPRWLGEAAFAPLVAAVRGAHRRHGAGGAIYVYVKRRRVRGDETAS